MKKWGGRESSRTQATSLWGARGHCRIAQYVSLLSALVRDRGSRRAWRGLGLLLLLQPFAVFAPFVPFARALSFPFPLSSSCLLPCPSRACGHRSRTFTLSHPGSTRRAAVPWSCPFFVWVPPCFGYPRLLVYTSACLERGLACLEPLAASASVAAPASLAAAAAPLLVLRPPARRTRLGDGPSPPASSRQYLHM